MNISTGGPHILLFERDQQLTGLLISEFQLAGYECHTARTAVEVFDAIARQPIRLVLVNLAQAAAARREFWVALDTQRRGRGVQVMTFHCSNIANYGPKDPDEHTTTMVDLEVDGMMGIMSLVDGVRARVPVGGNSIPTNTSPRMLRATAGQNSPPRAATQPAPNANTHFANSNAAGRSNESPSQQLSSAYRTQAPLLPPTGEPGFSSGEAMGRGQASAQAMGNAGNFSTQSSSYPLGMTLGSNGSQQQAAYSQNINSGSMPVQQPSYSQNTGMIGSQIQQQPVYAQNAQQNAQNIGAGNAPVQAPPLYAQTMGANSASAQQPNFYPQNMNMVSAPTQQPAPYPQNMGASSTPAQQQAPQNMGAANAAEQPSYTEKIRAVLYPNQRAWNPQGTTAATLAPENPPPFEMPGNAPAPQQPTFTNEATGSTVLQRLANGQAAAEGQWESGLAQLSRMVQERNTFLENTSNTPAYQMPKAPPIQQQQVVTPMQQPTPARPPMDQTFGQTAPTFNPTQRSSVQPETQADNLSMHTLRASPIQDLPGERSTSNSANTESGKRPDVLSRTNYAQQPATTLPSLASITAATQLEREKEEPRANTAKMARTDSQKEIPAIKTAPQTVRGRISQEVPAVKPAYETGRPIKATVIPEPPIPTPNRPVQESPAIVSDTVIQQTEQPQSRIYTSEQETQAGEKSEASIIIDQDISFPEQKSPSQHAAEINNYKEIENNKRFLEKAQAEIKVALGQQATFDTNNPPSNAMLLDILQSLPPMPAPSQQIQPQVLNGRATRSLGSVLLEGHLVPQNRLEVAQNVQRMLRGVDLNYQLGEILLMFKLLTPDQLLAASLVSYGMITTMQISSLGRIRQELHSMGLEYDLENLLIMFRILTPEQVREVRASW